MALKIMLAVMAVVGGGYLAFARAGNVNGSEARRLVASGALLVDVRTPGEFSAGHIAGAVNIPLQELGRRVGELGAKDRPIVLYCRSGNRSGTAAGMLAKAGYTAVHDLGAMTRW